MAGTQVNRTLTNVYLPSTVSSTIWQSVQNSSVVMQLAQRIDLPGAGVTIPIITGDASANWVAETVKKPVSRPTIDKKAMTPYKLAVIVPFSNEFRRDLSSLYNAMVTRLPNAIAKKYDETVFGYASSPGSGFDTMASIAEVDFTQGYTSLINAGQAVASAEDAALNGWVLSSGGQFLLLSAVDAGDRPLFVNSWNSNNAADATPLLGAPVYTSKHVADDTAPTVGIAGDWSYAYYGVVSGIQVAISDQAVILDTENGDAPIYLWQQNMFAVRVEAEVGFILRDDDAFVRLVGESS
jgi:HK97 family phage major capsid protein